MAKIPDGISLIEVKTYPPGIYFLCHFGEVVYIGQSVNILSRLTNHFRDKMFDEVYLMPCQEDYLDGEESKFIELLKPKYNKWTLF